MVGALLGEARPAGLDGDRLTIAFPGDADFSKRKAETHSALLKTALRGLSGHALRLEYNLSGDHPAAPATLSDDELLARLRDEFGAEEVFDDPPSEQD